MNNLEYRNNVIKHFNKRKVNKITRKEILMDLDEFLDNNSTGEIENHLGNPIDFVNSYLEESDLDTKNIFFISLFKQIVIWISILFFFILLSAPAVWLVTFTFRLHVEVGYWFQFFVSLTMFGVGYTGLKFFRKKNWV
ncbi:hypothetical protein A5816_002936 [Enterococcus sp. 3G1_DIV0629]|uniref:hypothetical protein n=1 Tax=Enterococcus sp. (strain 3G1_DIV0629) TaxID=1834176 RepID=UPI000A359F61|nr:hypothetical protein [Enterococcus sp. 3G1_DIV0629]EME3582112.1 hypothetical protein [Enterococcus faecium]OTO22261.1 hypothetical protein A5816_002933 [Enterococcus sp. 3G1_DIV0629]OTO22264.1 hypothetical protein A5816_002936 [Enterococcus sp. 3G1_DIV0629]